MRKYTDQAIIEKAYKKIQERTPEGSDFMDVAVDFEDDMGLIHSYAVTFRKEPESRSSIWMPLEINEISSL